jgi:hypothetical protein
VIDFDRLQELAADVRSFIQGSSDKANALKSIVTAFDVVLGIYPSGTGAELHVIKGQELLSQMTPNGPDYSHTAIAVQTREQAIALQALVA